jgi:hypothetical protein
MTTPSTDPAAAAAAADAAAAAAAADAAAAAAEEALDAEIMQVCVVYVFGCWGWGEGDRELGASLSSFCVWFYAHSLAY